MRGVQQRGERDAARRARRGEASATAASDLLTVHAELRELRRHTTTPRSQADEFRCASAAPTYSAELNQL